MKDRRCSRFTFKSGNTLNAALLTLLLEGPKIGYHLLDELKTLGFDSSEIPITIIYRLLRNMEVLGLTVSRWEIVETGPSKRIYYITNNGIKYLKDWQETARAKLFSINNLIENIDNKLKNI
jgi:DNA-binding PadR family transcriptional regulator